MSGIVDDGTKTRRYNREGYRMMRMSMLITDDPTTRYNCCWFGRELRDGSEVEVEQEMTEAEFKEASLVS